MRHTFGHKTWETESKWWWESSGQLIKTIKTEASFYQKPNQNQNEQASSIKSLNSLTWRLLQNLLTFKEIKDTIFDLSRD